MENQQNIQVPVSNNPEPIVETSSPQNNRGNKSMKVISIVWVIGCAVIAGGLTVYNFIASFFSGTNTLYIVSPIIFVVIQIVCLVFLLNMIGKAPSERSKVFIPVLFGVIILLPFLYKYTSGFIIKTGAVIAGCSDSVKAPSIVGLHNPIDRGDASGNHFYYLYEGCVFASTNGNTFELGATKILGVDLGSFKVLSVSPGYAVDKNHVYAGASVLKGISPDDLYALDQSTISFSSDFISDKNNLYLMGIKVDGADPSTFKSLADGNGMGPYYHDKNSIYVYKAAQSEDGIGQVIKMDYADRSTFKVYKNWLAYDKNNIYFNGLIVPGADPKSLDYLGYYYLKTNKGIYFFIDQGIVGQISSDVSNFKVLTYTIHSKDYVSGRSGTSYLCSGDAFGIDSTSVYFSGKVVKGADAKTFSNMGGGYGVDSSHVFYEGDTIKDASPHGFEADSCSTAHDSIGNKYLKGLINK